MFRFWFVRGGRFMFKELAPFGLTASRVKAVMCAMRAS